MILHGGDGVKVWGYRSICSPSQTQSLLVLSESAEGHVGGWLGGKYQVPHITSVVFSWLKKSISKPCDIISGDICISWSPTASACDKDHQPACLHLGFMHLYGGEGFKQVSSNHYRADCSLPSLFFSHPSLLVHILIVPSVLYQREERSA